MTLFSLFIIFIATNCIAFGIPNVRGSRNSLERERRGNDELDIQCDFDDNHLAMRKEHINGLDGNRFTRATADLNEAFVWDKGVIPYYFSKLTSRGDQVLIKKTMQMIEDRTCFRFKKLKGEPANHHLEIKIGNHSCEGFNAGVEIDQFNVNKVVLESLNQLTGSKCAIDWTNGILHEVFHVLGLQHTHARSDRDKHIKVFKKNIKDKKTYEVCEDCECFNVSYDCSSIMHFGTRTYSKPGKDTMRARDPSKCVLSKHGAAFDGRGASETDWQLLDIVSRKVCSTDPSFTTTAATAGICKFVDCSLQDAEKYCPTKCGRKDPEICAVVDCSIEGSKGVCPNKCTNNAIKN